MRQQISVLALVVTCVACGGGEADVTVTAVMEGADGVNLDEPWVVTFDQWLSTIDEIQLSDDRGRVVAGNGDTNIALDYVQADDPVEVVSFVSPTGTYDFNFGVEVPDRNSARITQRVEDTTLVLMERNTWTHIISGTAVGPAPAGQKLPVKFFEWTFDALSRNLACGDGVDVRGSGGEAEITMLAESLFWLSLAEADPATGFEHLALADQDEDGEITEEELRAAGVGAVDPDGEANNLYGYLRAALGRSVRLGPDGACDVRM